jgi:hypothetical protein
MINPFQPILDFFTGSWTTGEVGFELAKYIFLILIFIIIYSASKFLPFFKDKTGTQLIFSILVAFLAVAYLTPAEIYTMLASYTALGITLGTFIPLAIIFYFTFEIGKHPSPSSVVLQYFLWLSFGAWLVYKLIVGMQADLLTDIQMYIYFGVLALVIIFVVFNKTLRKWMFKGSLDSKVTAAKQDIQRRAAARKLETDEADARDV